MNGLQLIHILRSGQRIIKVTAVTLLFTLFLSACSAEWWIGDGRGDWTLDLYEGYAIAKINSNEILVVHKENPDDSGGTIVLPNYFVIGYQLYGTYICLEGISTQEISISEDELNSMILSYYLIDTTKDEVIGPYESYVDFKEYGRVLGLEIVDDWIEINGNPVHATLEYGENYSPL